MDYPQHETEKKTYIEIDSSEWKEGQCSLRKMRDCAKNPTQQAKDKIAAFKKTIGEQ